MAKQFNRDVNLSGGARLTKDGTVLIDADGNIDAPVTTTNLTTSGNTTLGDTSADTLTVPSTSNFTAPSTLTSTSAGAAGQTLTFFHDSASPAAADIVGRVNFKGNDDGGNEHTYGAVGTAIIDPTDSTEQGVVGFYCSASNDGALELVGIWQTDGTTAQLVIGDALSAGGAQEAAIITADSSNGSLNLTPDGTGKVLVNKPAAFTSTETIAAGGTSTALSLNTTISYVDADAGGDIFTLADGVNGQIKTVIMASATGTATVTPANFIGGTSVTMNAAGDTATFMFSSAASAWALIGSNSASVI